MPQAWVSQIELWSCAVEAWDGDFARRLPLIKAPWQRLLRVPESGTRAARFSPVWAVWRRAREHGLADRLLRQRFERRRGTGQGEHPAGTGTQAEIAARASLRTTWRLGGQNVGAGVSATASAVPNTSTAEGTLASRAAATGCPGPAGCAAKIEVFWAPCTRMTVASVQAPAMKATVAAAINTARRRPVFWRRPACRSALRFQRAATTKTLRQTTLAHVDRFFARLST